MEDKKPNVLINNQKESEKIIHELKPAAKAKTMNFGIMILTVLVVGAGVLTGYFLSKGKGGLMILEKGGPPKMIKSGKMVGSTDKKSFRDMAEGKLEKGGIDSEGSHKLIRPGGASQTVYLTSSVINLDDYVGKKVRVWGETFAAQKAGWLMDVGRIELL